MTERLEEILNFEFNASRFVSFGRNLFVSDTEKALRQNITTLGALKRTTATLSRSVPVDGEKIYDEFMMAAPNGYDNLRLTFGTRRKVRKLSWLLGVKPKGKDAVIQTDYLPDALRLIDSSYRPSMLLGLLDCLLEWWTTLREPYKSTMMRTVEERLSSFKGRNPKLIKLKEMAPYFTKPTGTAALAVDLIKKDQRLGDVWEHFEFGKSMQRYSYFSEVALHYVQASRRLNKLTDEMRGIADFLSTHTENVKGLEISKRILSNLIDWAKESSSVEHQGLLKSEAFRLIGDPASDVEWSKWPGISDGETKLLKNARKTLNEWLAIQIIEVFFGNHLLGMDKHRKKFWLNYCNHIDQFKIFTNRTVLYSLSADERIQPFARTRLGLLTGAGNQMSALVFVIKNYVFVEFSTTGGAFYAYRRHSSLCPDISQHTMNISQLRKPDRVDNLIDTQTRRFHSEGRFGHLGDWQYYLSRWINHHLEI